MRSARMSGRPGQQARSRRVFPAQPVLRPHLNQTRSNTAEMNGPSDHTTERAGRGSLPGTRSTEAAGPGARHPGTESSAWPDRGPPTELPGPPSDPRQDPLTTRRVRCPHAMTQFSWAATSGLTAAGTNTACDFSASSAVTGGTLPEGPEYRGPTIHGFTRSDRREAIVGCICRPSGRGRAYRLGMWRTGQVFPMMHLTTRSLVDLRKCIRQALGVNSS